jgi:preprotein translocase subunit SecF/SecD/SecF fusion protein
LTHDVLLTVGIFSLLQLEFDLSIVAALLTILGYSVNDTVVVSDRIRENLRKYKRMEIDELLDVSINETLSRTVLTGCTALAVLLALYIFGGEVIRNFNFAMLFGIIVGTYSSVFIGAPLLGYLGVKREWGAGGTAATGAAAAARARRANVAFK